MRALLIAEWVVRLVMFAVVVVRKRSTPVALAWLAVVAFVPFAGAVAYFLLGEVRLGRRRSARYQSLVAALGASADLRRQFATYPAPALPGPVRRIAQLAQAVGASEPRPGNRVELHDDATRLFERLVGDIHGARHHCHLQFYIADDDPVSRLVVEALVRARQRGVACRVLLDAAGSRTFLRGALTRRLRSARGGSGTTISTGVISGCACGTVIRKSWAGSRMSLIPCWRSLVSAITEPPRAFASWMLPTIFSNT